MEEKLSDKYQKEAPKEIPKEPENLSAIPSGSGMMQQHHKNNSLSTQQNGNNNQNNSNYNNYNQNTQQPNRQRVAPPREALFTLMVGETGAGKTVQIIKECLAYVQPNPLTGKKGRPVFIFHPNVLFEPQYMKTFKNHIRIEQIRSVTAPEVYIILPINSDGSIMDDQQKRDAIIYIVNTCMKCLTVLDDIDDVLKGAKPRDMDKLFVSYRHRSIDLITTHQFLNPITTQEWGAVTSICLRKTVQSVSIISDRVPNPEILYIAEMIVAEQYDLAHNMYRDAKISEDEFKFRKSFFVEVNIRTNRIKGGFSKECFIRNCKKYLNLNGRKISDFQKIYCDAEGKPIYNREKSIEKIIHKDLWRYFAGKQ